MGTHLSLAPSHRTLSMLEFKLFLTVLKIGNLSGNRLSIIFILLPTKLLSVLSLP
jgi:hypothetical protein